MGSGQGLRTSNIGLAPRGELLRNCYCFKLCNRPRLDAVMQSDILEIHNFVGKIINVKTESFNIIIGGKCF